MNIIFVILTVQRIGFCIAIFLNVFFKVLQLVTDRAELCSKTLPGSAAPR